MVLHIVSRNNLFLVFGYTIDKNKKLNGSGPGTLIATTKGYLPQTNKIADEDYVIAKEYVYGSCDNTPEQLSKLLDGNNISHLCIDTKSTKLVRYMKAGDSFNGYTKDDFSIDIHSIPHTTFKVKSLENVTLDTYVTELVNLAKINGMGILQRNEDSKYWAPKVEKPYWVFGNTLICMKENNKSAFVSVTTSLKVEKDMKAVKNNNIHKVLTDTNYTISLTSDSTLLDGILNGIENKLNIPMLIRVTELFNKDTVRVLTSTEDMIIEKYYNNIEFSAINGNAVAVKFMPPGLLFKMQTEVFRTIKLLLHGTKYKTIDITEYLIDDKGSIRKEFNNTETIKIPYGNKKIIIRLGVDTLPKNNLKKIEKGLKVNLCIFENDNVYKYFTVIEDHVNDKKLISYAPFNNKGIK